jgi:hypothetical protein
MRWTPVTQKYETVKNIKRIKNPSQKLKARSYLLHRMQNEWQGNQVELTLCSCSLLFARIHGSCRMFKWIILQDKHDLSRRRRVCRSWLGSSSLFPEQMQFVGIIVIFCRICMKKFCRSLMISFSLLTSISRLTMSYDVFFRLYVSFHLISYSSESVYRLSKVVLPVERTRRENMSMHSIHFSPFFVYSRLTPSSRLSCNTSMCVLFSTVSGKKRCKDSSTS